MAQTKQGARRKRKRRALPVLGAAGLSLSLASGSAGAMNASAAEHTLPQAGVGQEITLAEEEISDVSLATFYVFDKEDVGAGGPRVRLAMAGACGCMGCSGCGCWTGTYYNSSVFGNDTYPPPPPRKPASKYAKTPKNTQTPKNQ